MRKMENITSIKLFIYLMLILLIAGLTACKEEGGVIEKGGVIEIEIVNTTNAIGNTTIRITTIDDSVLYDSERIPQNSKKSYNVHVDGYYKIYMYYNNYLGYILQKSVYVEGGKTIVVTINSLLY